MKKILIFLFVFFCVTIFSCSPEEETQAPTSTVQSTTPVPEPETPETVVVQYTLTVTAGEGGNVTAGGTFDDGTSVSVTATPNEGYEFIGWEGSDASESSLTITLNGDMTLNALFESITYSLTVTAGAGGILSTEGGTYDEGTSVSVTATANEGYHFIGFNGIDGFENTISITMNSNKTIQPNFLIKDDGHKQRSNTFFDENELDYLTSENFIVWWDKDNDFNNERSYVGKSIILLNDVESVYDISIGYGMEYPVGSENTYINIFLFDYWNEDGDDIIRGTFQGAGVGTDGNSMPFFPFPNTFFENIGPNIYNNNIQQPSRGVLFHETYHVMQYKSGNYYNTFPYTLENTWYTETTARWFERKYAYPEVFDGDWGSKYNGQGALNLQPQVSMWGGLENKPYFSEISWSHGNHRYEMAEFIRFLIQYNKIDESFVHQSFYSGTELLPQEYLYENIEDLEGIYGDFSSKYVSGIIYNDLELQAIKSSTEFYSTCQVSTNCNEETGIGFNNQYVSEIDESGTSGYVTPVEKNEAWSWTVVKINTSQEQSFTIDFQPDGFGNEGTQSNFNLYLTNRENNLVQEVDFNGEITVNPNLDYFLVMVNTPQRFEGWETFDYQLKVTPNN